jgi:methylated-DNA-[protein]-cysteine S-methyltransferase
MDIMRIYPNIVKGVNRRIVKPTPFGSVGIIWISLRENPKIIRVLISKPGLPAEDQAYQLYPDSRVSSCSEIENLAEAVKGFLEGEPVGFSLDLTNLNKCTDFQKRVLLAEHAIPRGSVSSYRLIAEHLGRIGGARAVGNALANNPFPLIVPCHRAVRSDRHLGGYQGGLEMKRTLLEYEGISFDSGGRVECPHFHYERK